jgi:MFS family permease
VAETALPLTYRSLARVRGFPRLLAAALLGRTAVQMMSVSLVLYALDRFRSPAVAGIAIFAAIFPGIVVSPLAGAALDRWGRVRLITADYSVAAGALALIVGLGAAGALSAPLLVAIAALSSLTWPLSNAGTRSLFPQMVPRPLWDRANAIDSTTYVLAIVIGAPVAAGIAAGAGRPVALAATAGVFAAAALSLLGMRVAVPSSAPARGFLRDAWEGLAYLAHRPTLRGLAVAMSVFNLAQGILIVALPVLILDRLHQSAALVGLMWGLLGLAQGVCSVSAGQRGSEGRERRAIVLAMLLDGVVAGGLLLAAAAWPGLPVRAGLALTAAGALAYGAAAGPMNVALFALRQRRTDPRWYGRAFAVSMSVNYLGTPIGSALAGVLLAAGYAPAFGAVAGVAVGAALLVLLAVPSHPAPNEASSSRAVVRR